jgi:prepilin-type N-terminal cleavage/methylation domain-containing protein
MIFVTGKKKNLQDKIHGFTLIELLIVTAVIGILILCAIPYFKNTYNSFKISISTKKIASIITYARQKAILERTKYRLNFDYYNNKYWLTVEKDPLNYPDYYICTKRTHYFPEGVFIDSYFSFITFYPDGKIDEKLLTLKNESGDKYLLEIGRRVNHVKITSK